MKTAEEIAIKHGLYHSFTKKADESALQAMKEYAKEVARESLNKASLWAYMVNRKTGDTSDIIDGFVICKESILNEDNIPEL